MEFSTDWLAKTFPEYQGAVHLDISLNEVCIDAFQTMNKGLFVPIDTKENNDQADMLKNAISNGAIAAIWDEETPVPSFVPTDFPIFFVRDTKLALRELAEAYLSEVNPEMLCMVGGNGVGITKDWVGSVLSRHYEVFQPNHLTISDVDLSLAILGIPPKTEVCIIEFDLINKGQILDLSLLAKPSIGVITDIPTVDSDAIIQKSVEIFAGIKENGFVILDGDEPAYSPLHERVDVISCGFQETNTNVLVQDRNSKENIQFTLNGEAYSIQTTDISSMKFAGYTVTVCKALGLDQDSIQSGLSAGH